MMRAGTDGIDTTGWTGLRDLSALKINVQSLTKMVDEGGEHSLQTPLLTIDCLISVTT